MHCVGSTFGSIGLGLAYGFFGLIERPLRLVEVGSGCRRASSGLPRVQTNVPIIELYSWPAPMLSAAPTAGQEVVVSMHFGVSALV